MVGMWFGDASVEPRSIAALHYLRAMSYTIVIAGRPNVGKSTLYNRLTGTDDAIVDPTAGVTRDRKYGIGEWGKKSFVVIDTGGIADEDDEGFEKEINGQVNLAISEADLVLFLVDGKEGLTDADRMIAQKFRKRFLHVRRIGGHLFFNTELLLHFMHHSHQAFAGVGTIRWAANKME